MHELVHLQSLSSISQSPFAVLNLSRLPPISASLKGKNNSYVNFNVFMFTITIIKECYFSLAPGHLPVKQGMLIFQLRYQSSEWLASQVIRLLPAVQPSNWRVTNTITQLFTGCTNQHRIVCKKPRNNNSDSDFHQDKDYVWFCFIRTFGWLQCREMAQESFYLLSSRTILNGCVKGKHQQPNKKLCSIGHHTELFAIDFTLQENLQNK